MKNNQTQVEYDAEEWSQPGLFSWLDIVCGLAVYILAAIWLLANTPDFSVPDRWTSIAVWYTGLDPFRPLNRPLWSMMAWIVSSLPFANISVVLNNTTALIGAASCWLVFDLVRRIPMGAVLSLPDDAETEARPRMLAGLVAAAYFAVALPVMETMTRGDYRALDVLLVLVVFYPVALYRQKQLPGLFYASCVAAGLASIEFPAIVPLLPLLAYLWGRILPLPFMPKKSVMIMGVILYAAVVISLFIYAAMMAESRVAIYRDLADSGKVLKEFFGLYWNEFRQATLVRGGLMVLVFCFAPLILVVWRRFPDLTISQLVVPTESPVKGFFALAALLMLFGAAGTREELGSSVVAPVLPVLATAIWFGFLAGDGFKRYLPLIKNKKSRIGVGVAAGLLLVTAGARHAFAAYPSDVLPVIRFAREVVEQLDGRAFIITDGQFDDALRVAGRNAGKLPVLLNVNSGNDPGRGRYHASLFLDPELQDMARLGVMPLLRDWFARDARLHEKAVLLINPDNLVPDSMVAMPDALFYRLDPVGALTRPIVLNERQDKLADSGIFNPGEDDEPHQRVVAIQRWLSMLANDLGVYWAERDQMRRAIESYQRALSYWPDNPSAILNVMAAYRMVGDLNDASQYKSRLVTLAEDYRTSDDGRIRIMLQGRLYQAAALLDEAGVLGLTGRSLQAENRARSASRLIAEDDPTLQLSLARLYLKQQQVEESEEIYLRMLERNPRDLDALQGLLRIDMARGLYDRAEKRIDRLEELGFSIYRIKLERANVMLGRGDFAGARKIYQELTEISAPMIEAWYMLGLIALYEDDQSLFREASGVLADERSFMPGMLLLGEWALREGRYGDARLFLDQARMLEPTSLKVMERLLLLDYQARDAEALRERSAAMLALDPDHPLGLFGSASVHIAEGQYDLAEIPLRRCLGIVTFAPALNELAWILGEKGALDEALEHARLAVELMPRDANAHDTLALILDKRGELDEAAAMMEKALELSGSFQVPLAIRAADILSRAGKVAEARRLLSRLQLNLPLLPPETGNQVKRLADRMDETDRKGD